MMRRPPVSTLVPYTTLVRSGRGGLDGEGGLDTACGGRQDTGAFEGDHSSRRGGYSPMVVKQPGRTG